MTNINFKERISIEQVEESHDFAPKFDSQGLIPVVTTDYLSGELLMHGYMNEEALKMTILLGEAVYYSRSRKTLWHKGATSGLTQLVKELRIDDDQDCIDAHDEAVRANQTAIANYNNRVDDETKKKSTDFAEINPDGNTGIADPDTDDGTEVEGTPAQTVPQSGSGDGDGEGEPPKPITLQKIS